MASYKPIKITKKGMALMGKVISGATGIRFTKLQASETQYKDSVIESLTSLSGVKQTTMISKITRQSDGSVMVTGVFDNKGLEAPGYCMRTIGIFATDPDEGEILYAVMSAETTDFMPPDNGKSHSSVTMNLSISVGNSDAVSVTVSGSAFATVEQLSDLDNKYKEKTSVYFTQEADGIYVNYD